MNIFLICQQALRRHDVPAYSFWAYYLKSAMKEEGHRCLECPEVDWAEGLTHLDPEARCSWLDRSWTKSVAAINSYLDRGEKIDFVLCYLFPNQVDPSAIREIQRLGVPCVNFFCDNVREFSRVPAVFAPFGLHWVPEHDACALYRKAGFPHVHAPMPAWVPPGERRQPDRESDDITFIGSRDILRATLLSEAVELGMPLRLHGAGWANAPAEQARGMKRPSAGSMLLNQMNLVRRDGLWSLAMKLSYKLHRDPSPEILQSKLRTAIQGEEEYFRVLRESAVTLGINRYPSFRHPAWHPHRYSRLRDIEAPMLGCCYLTENAPGLEELYNIGTEIETFTNAAELSEKALMLLSDPARRRAMRTAAQTRALNEHTIGKTLSRIAGLLNVEHRQ